MRKLVLFDIDGTLILTDGAGRRAIHRALFAHMGAATPSGDFRFDGKTDPQIVTELLGAAGHPDPHGEEQVRAVCDRYLELLEVELAAGRREVRVLEGVPELLADLESRPEVVVGLLTGNLARGAQLKLDCAGLRPERFRVGAFGSDAARRDALPRFAVDRAAPLMGRVPSGDDVVIVGDTPADVTCGAEVGARAIGVATGSYSRDELAAAGAYATFDDLSDTRAVVTAMLA